MHGSCEENHALIPGLVSFFMMRKLQNSLWVLCDRHDRIIAFDCHVDQVLPREMPTVRHVMGALDRKITTR